MHVLRERREDLLQAGLCQVRLPGAGALLLSSGTGAQGWWPDRAPGERASPAPLAYSRAPPDGGTPREPVSAASLRA